MKSMATRWVLLLALLLLPAGLAVGQGTTASITGQVVDENGEPLPGANVLAVHQPTGTQYGAATNANGRFNLLNLRVGGPYTVTASFVGYQSARETEINLQLDEKQSLNFQLVPSTAELDEIEVVAQRSAVINKDRTGAATNVSEEEIDRLPTIGRSITDFTRLTPQATGSGSFAGQNDRYNAIQIDGATLDDVFGLGDAVPGSQAGAQPISLDAIQEFNVNIAPYDVRSSGFTGAQVNAITKSGTNEYTGSFRVRRGTENFTGDLNGIGTNEFDQTYYVGTFGGPIIEDELFFFVTGELKRESSPLDVRVGDDLEGPNVFPIDPNRLQTLDDIAQEVYGYDAGLGEGDIGALTQRQDDEKLLVKLDWNINEDHRLTLRNNYVNARDDDGISRSTNTFGFSNRQYVFRSVQNSLTAQLNSTFSNSMFNELRVVYTRIRDERDVQDAAFPEIDHSLTSDQSAFMGIDRFSQANRLNQDLIEITDNLTYITGDHNITIGTSNKIYSFENLFIQDFFGSYIYESFTYENASGEEVQVSEEEAFRRGQPTEYRFSYATPAAGSNQPLAEFSALQLGLYAQDEWSVTPSLELTGGVRVDVPFVPNEPTNNPDAEAAFGRSTSNVATGNPLFSPRIGFNFDKGLVSDEFSTQIRGGVGIFSGDPPYVWISNQFSNTGADLFRIDRNFRPGEDFVDENGNYDPNFRFQPTSSADEPTNQPCPPNSNPDLCSESEAASLLNPEGTTEVNFISDDFQFPQTFRTNLAIDQELPNGFVATVEGIYSKSINDVVFRNLNVGTPESGLTESKYGRPFYGSPGAGFSGQPNRLNGGFTNALLLENTDKGYSYSLTGQIQRRVRQGINGSLSYTYNRAENVNNGTSSRAISNWQFNENKDINDPRLGTADFELRHRILGTLNYRFEWLDRFATSVGIVYEGRSGQPFSWIYFGDANGDGQTFNDLVYVPENESDIVLESENWDAFNAFIESEDALDEARGEVIRRNTATAPWQNALDLHFSQEFTTINDQRVEFTLDMVNVLNWLNDDWGRQQFTSFNNITGWDFLGYVENGDIGTQMAGRIITADDVGKPVVNFSEDTINDKLSDQLFNTSNIGSRWRIRLGVKYTF